MTRLLRPADLVPWLRQARSGHVALLMLCEVIAASAPVLTAVLTGAMADDVMSPAARTPWGAFAGFCVAVVAGWSAATARVPLRSRVARDVDGALRARTLRSLDADDVDTRLERPEIAEDVARVFTIDGSLDRSVGHGAVAQVANLAGAVGAVMLAAAIGAHVPVLAVVLLAAVPTLRSRLQRQLRCSWQAFEELAPDMRRGEYLEDLLCGPAAAKEVRVFGIADWLLARRDEEMRDTERAAFGSLAGILREELLLFPAVLALAVAAILVPALAVLDGRLTPGDFATVAVAAISMFALVQAGGEQQRIEPGRAAASAYARLWGSAPGTARRRAETAAAPVGVTEAGPPEIRYEEVSFAYELGPRVLDLFTLTIGSGEVLAVVGDNGAGKTTFTRLMAGLRRPGSGRVVMDRGMTAGGAATTPVAVLFQDFQRYPLSLRQNVALHDACSPEGDALVLEALRLAGMRDLVERLPARLDTTLSRVRTGGVDLSGGQWQRVALARVCHAVLTGAQVVVLDEPTAHLDVHAEASFYDDVVDRLRGHATIILISHRLSTVRHADRIVVLRDGRPAEAGSHAELLRTGGSYARAFALQAAAYDVAAQDGGTT